MKKPQPDAGPLDAIEIASRDEISALQLARLKSTLLRAYSEVEHYRQKFEAHGVHPQDLRELADLKKFPFLNKSDLRDHFPFGLFAVPREQVVRLHASSGTTGKPTIVGYTKNDIDTWSALVARSLHAAGARSGDIVQVAYGYGLFTGGLGAHYGAERLGCTVIPISGGQTEKQVQLIQDLQPDVIMVTPSYMQVIIEEFTRQGLDARETSLRIGLFGAEPWTEAMRTELQSKSGIDAIDLYGLSEVMGPGVACECFEAKDGPVIWEDHFYPEIIDPVSGEVLADGQEGELVITALTKEALPVIRYRTRDLTRLLPATSRSFRRIGKIVGRSDDMLIIRGVNVFPTQIETIVLQNENLSGQYQLMVSREGFLDEVEVRCELQPGASHLGTAERAAIGEWLARQVKALVGISITVTVLLPGAIERTLVGKARRVFDRRAQP